MTLSLLIRCARLIPFKSRTLSLLYQKAYSASADVFYTSYALIALLLKYARKFFEKLRAITLLLLDTRVAKAIIEKVGELMNMESV